jgi:2,3-bisphosphoglycerate-independent phosphoglycerate mutase
VSDLKYVIVVLTGLGDQPLESLQGRTPLETAATPNLDRVSSSGRLGLVNPFHDSRRAGSEMTLLSLLGIDTHGLSVSRGALEAAGMGIALDDVDLALRMNFVSTFKGILVDHNAGQIQGSEAAVLIKMLNARLGTDKIKFHAGLGYRNLLVLKGFASLGFETVPPHEIIQQPVKDFYPYGPDAGLLVDLIEKARGELEKHDINRVRVDLGENPADMIWLWGQGRDCHLPAFSTLFPLKGSVVGAVPLIRGIAGKTGFDVVTVPGVTGGVDTNFAGKVDAALLALQRSDLVILHVGAVNEACHESNPVAKIAAIEKVDSHVVGPLLDRLEDLGRWRLMVATDHITSSQEATRVSGPVPVAFCGHEVEGVRNYTFTEANAARSDMFVDRGYTLMEFFLGIKRL